MIFIYLVGLVYIIPVLFTVNLGGGGWRGRDKGLNQNCAETKQPNIN